MTDDYARQGETFRAHEVNVKKLPIMVVGAHARTFKGVESVACTDASVHSLSPPAGTLFSEITMEGAATTDYVRYWHTGTDPTSTVGVKLFDGQVMVSGDPASFTAIKGSTGAGGTLRVEHFAFE